jgi:hypothetical protein
MNQLFSPHKYKAVYSGMSPCGLGKMDKLIASMENSKLRAAA